MVIRRSIFVRIIVVSPKASRPMKFKTRGQRPSIPVICDILLIYYSCPSMCPRHIHLWLWHLLNLSRAPTFLSYHKRPNVCSARLAQGYKRHFYLYPPELILVRVCKKISGFSDILSIIFEKSDNEMNTYPQNCYIGSLLMTRASCQMCDERK